MTEKTIKIAKDFTRFPGLRYKKSTPGKSGEEFRDSRLIPEFDKNDRLTVDLDGNIGWYGPSFLEESFGGLVRKKKITSQEFNEKVNIVSDDDPDLIKEIQRYVEAAAS